MTGLVGVTIALAAHADAGDVDFFIGRFTVGQSDPPGRPEAQPRQPRLFQKISTIGPVSHGCPSLFWYRAPFAFWPRAEARRKLVYQFQSNRRKPRKRRKRPLCYLCFLLFKKVELETPSSRLPPTLAASYHSAPPIASNCPAKMRTKKRKEEADRRKKGYDGKSFTFS